MSEVNREYIRKWVETLRSEEYKKVEGYYARRRLDEEHACFCAVGVGVAMLAPEDAWEYGAVQHRTIGTGSYRIMHLSEEWFRKEIGEAPRGFDDMSCGAVVHARSGLSDEELEEIMERNDGDSGFRPHSFLEMADYLEATYLTEQGVVPS